MTMYDDDDVLLCATMTMYDDDDDVRRCTTMTMYDYGCL